MIPVALLLLLAARWPEATSLPNIDEFHSQMLRRFAGGKAFGMSRIVVWPTLGRHFRAPIGAKVDFKPENEQEQAILDRWSSGGWQTGLYVFGAAISSAPESARFHRALKGPGVLNENTPRAELPTWNAVYPAAVEAMRRFESGATAHIASVDGWTLVARPVTASKETCAKCHSSDGNLELGAPLGGVIYLYRR